MLINDTKKPIFLKKYQIIFFSKNLIGPNSTKNIIFEPKYNVVEQKSQKLGKMELTWLRALSDSLKIGKYHFKSPRNIRSTFETVNTHLRMCASEI